MRTTVAGVLIVLALLAAWFVRGSHGTPATPPQRDASTATTSPPAALQSEPGTPALPGSRGQPSSSASAPITSPAAAAPEGADILVHGSLLDEHGQPVSTAWLSWIDGDGGIHEASSSAGSYSAAGLRPGTYVVQLLGVGWRQEQIDVVVASAPAAQRRDFVLHANPVLEVRVASPDGTELIGLDEQGKILAGNRLQVCAIAAGTVRLSEGFELSRSRFTNRWQDKERAAPTEPDFFGWLELYSPSPQQAALVLGTAIVATCDIRGGETGLRFIIDAAHLKSRYSGIRARFLQEDGKTPCEGAGIMLMGGGTGQAQSDATGVAEIRDLLPGWYEVSVHASRCGRQLCVTLPPGEVLDLGDLVLRPGPTFELRFEQAGDPTPQAFFVMRREDPLDPLATLGPNDYTLHGTSGKNPYEIKSFDPGRYLLRVVCVGDPRDRPARTIGARPIRVNLVEGVAGSAVVPLLQTTTVCFRPPHESDGLARWLVSTSDGLPCQRVRTEGRVPERIELVPGEYTIARIDPETNKLGKAQSFTVGSDFQVVELAP